MCSEAKHIRSMRYGGHTSFSLFGGFLWVLVYLYSTKVHEVMNLWTLRWLQFKLFLSQLLLQVTLAVSSFAHLHCEDLCICAVVVVV